MSDERTDGRTTRWEAHRLQRRAHIVAAAVEVLEERPRDQVHVQDIAERAGVTRAVVYRHFRDRADLDGAVQAHVLELLRQRLEPAAELRGTPRDMIGRLVAAYVGWVADHPSLHRIAERRGSRGGPSGGYGALVAGTESRLDTLLTGSLHALGIELDRHEHALRLALTSGLMAFVYGAVHRWSGLVERPEVEDLVASVTDTVWFVLDGHLRLRGLEIDPDTPLG